MLMRKWTPLGVWSEIDRLHHEMNRVFGRSPSVRHPRFAGAYPAVNLWEDEDKLYVEAELPGMELADLEIYVNAGTELTIKGERKAPSCDQSGWHRRERGYGSFSRTLELPTDVESDKVEAHFKHGVLLIELPKREEVKPRRIEVKAD